MGKVTTRNINIEVPHEVWKKLKILSVHMDITLQEVVRNILEKEVNRKNKVLEDIVVEV